MLLPSGGGEQSAARLPKDARIKDLSSHRSGPARDSAPVGRTKKSHAIGSYPRLAVMPYLIEDAKAESAGQAPEEARREAEEILGLLLDTSKPPCGGGARPQHDSGH